MNHTDQAARDARIAAIWARLDEPPAEPVELVAWLPDRARWFPRDEVVIEGDGERPDGELELPPDLHVVVGGRP
jgi:hypothetical protein